MVRDHQRSKHHQRIRGSKHHRRHPEGSRQRQDRSVPHTPDFSRGTHHSHQLQRGRLPSQMQPVVHFQGQLLERLDGLALGPRQNPCIVRPQDKIRHWRCRASLHVRCHAEATAHRLPASHRRGLTLYHFDKQLRGLRAARPASLQETENCSGRRPRHRGVCRDLYVLLHHRRRGLCRPSTVQEASQNNGVVHFVEARVHVAFGQTQAGAILPGQRNRRSKRVDHIAGPAAPRKAVGVHLAMVPTAASTKRCQCLTTTAARAIHRRSSQLAAFPILGQAPQVPAGPTTPEQLGLVAKSQTAGS